MQDEGTHTRGMWEQNSHHVKLQLIIIVTDNKACDKRVEAMLTPFIMDTKAKEVINLSPSYLLEGCHLVRKEVLGRPAGSKREETSQSHTEEMPLADEPRARSCSWRGEPPAVIAHIQLLSSSNRRTP